MLMDFNVVFQDKLYHFAPFDTGLYYYDSRVAPEEVTKIVMPKTNNIFSSYLFIQTVEDNKRFYSDSENKGVERARLQQENIG